MNYNRLLPRKQQRPSKQTNKAKALQIIRRANKYKYSSRKFHYKIARDLSIRMERVRVCLKNASAGVVTIFNHRRPWKSYPRHFYDIKTWMESVKKNKDARNQKNVDRAIENAKAVIRFIKYLHNQPIIFQLKNGLISRKYVRRSVSDYLYQYKFQIGTPLAKKSTIYRHIQHNRKDYKRFYFANLYKGPQVKRAKVNFPKLPYQKIDKQPAIVKGEANHFQADSVIGRLTDKKALATSIDVETGEVKISLYDRKATSFAKVIAARIGTAIKSLRIDNGAENAHLHRYLPRDKIFTCYPYSSWQKGVIENMHRLIRRLWPKGKSMDSLTDKAVAKIEMFINNYYRPRYSKQTI